MKQLKGIIFDLDSTLIDVDLNFNAIRDALGIPEGHPILEWLDKLEDQEKKEKLHQRLHEFELEAAKNSSIISHVEDTLIFLKEKNLNLGILTRNCKEVAHLELSSLKNFFNPIFSREDHEDCKPNPGGIHGTCKAWKVKPENILMIGDYLFDLQAGHNAGAKSIWFNNPKYQDRDFSKEADYSFNSYEDFKNDFELILEKLELFL